MPLYDFRCAACADEREVTVPLARADSLELVCFGCGGTMRKAVSRTVSFVQSASPASPPPASRRPARSHTCSDGAVKLRRPNPFAADLPGAPRPGEG